MTAGVVRFDRFMLDTGNRRLLRDDVPVEVNGRYLDALALMVREAGRLVSKDRFLDEVWRGVPVTDEALTQCVKTLRRQLGDDAGRPRFIETVPKHGYRFIAAVTEVTDTSPGVVAGVTGIDWRRLFLLGGAGTLGAGIAGVIGGMFYGFVGAADPLAPGIGQASVLLVLMWLTIAAALIGGGGVSFGLAAAELTIGRWRFIVGGAAGGLLVGGVVKLLGLDAFNLLLGRSPGDITGGLEGLLLGGGVGVGAWLAERKPVSIRRATVVAGAAGLVAGVVVPMIGGHLMGGSLDLLARQFPGSQLSLDAFGALVGEPGFGPVSAAITGGMEGFLFAACIVGAISMARRRIDAAR